MANIVHNIGASAPSAQVERPKPPEGGGAFASAVGANAAASGASASNTAISPRITVDPIAGVITQFLASDGKVELQLPSVVAVAYLRAGLSSEGLRRPAAPGGTGATG